MAGAVAVEQGGGAPLQELFDAADPLAAVADDADMLHHRACERRSPNINEVYLHAWPVRVALWLPQSLDASTRSHATARH